MDEFIKQLAEEKKKQNQLIEDLIASPNYQAWGDSIKPTPEEEQKLYDYWSAMGGQKFLNFKHYIDTRDEIVAKGLQKIAEGMGMIKLAPQFLEDTYKGFADRKEGISNPTVLKFMKDYEKYMKTHKKG